MERLQAHNFDGMHFVRFVVFKIIPMGYKGRQVRRFISKGILIQTKKLKRMAPSTVHVKALRKLVMQVTPPAFHNTSNPLSRFL